MKIANELLMYCGGGNYDGTCVPADEDESEALHYLSQYLRDIGDTATNAARWLHAHAPDAYWDIITSADEGKTFILGTYTPNGYCERKIACENLTILPEMYPAYPGDYTFNLQFCSGYEVLRTLALERVMCAEYWVEVTEAENPYDASDEVVAVDGVKIDPDGDWMSGFDAELASYFKIAQSALYS